MNYDKSKDNQDNYQNIDSEQKVDFGFKKVTINCKASCCVFKGTSTSLSCFFSPFGKGNSVVEADSI